MRKPIVSTDTGAIAGSMVLGIKPAGFGAAFASAQARSGLWMEGRLRLPALDAAVRETLGREIGQAIYGHGNMENSLAVAVYGAPHLVIYKLLNPGSRFPPAYQVSLYPLADEAMKAGLRRLRWQIVCASGL